MAAGPIGDLYSHLSLGQGSRRRVRSEGLGAAAAHEGVMQLMTTTA